MIQRILLIAVLGRGVRKINFLRVVASGYWALGLKVTSNLSFYRLSKLASPHMNDRELRPYLASISRFERVAPRDMVDVFDRLVPGSGAAWKSIFWDIIENPRLSGAPLNDSIARLPLVLREKISYLDKTGRPTKRKRLSSFGEIESIARISTLDALGVLLLLAEETKAFMSTSSGALWLKHYTTYQDIAWASDFLIARLAIFSPFRDFADSFRDLVFKFIIQCPERIELEKQIAKMFLNRLPECSRNFRVITQVGRWLLHNEAFNDVTFSSDQQALQFVYDRLVPISRCSIEEFERKVDLLWDCPFAHIMYDAIFYGDVNTP